MKPLATRFGPGGDDGGCNGGIAGWVHVKCALYTPGMYFQVPDTFDRPCGLATVHPDRWNLQCVICRDKAQGSAAGDTAAADSAQYEHGFPSWKAAVGRAKASKGVVGQVPFWSGAALLERVQRGTGAPIQCDFGVCCSAYHPLCAQRLNCEARLGGDDED